MQERARKSDDVYYIGGRGRSAARKALYTFHFVLRRLHDDGGREGKKKRPGENERIFLFVIVGRLGGRVFADTFFPPSCTSCKQPRL